MADAAANPVAVAVHKAVILFNLDVSFIQLYAPGPYFPTGAL